MLDTHIAVWAALDPNRLTRGECLLMEGADGPIVLSAVAVWELRLKWRSLHVSGERKGPIGPASVMAFATAMAWEFLALTPGHAMTELVPPLNHKDPFDELLLVQAQAEGMRLLTRDTKLAGHPFATAGQRV